MVFSSTNLTASSAFKQKRSPSIGTKRGSTSQYRQNFSQQTCTLMPMTMLGLSAGLPLAFMRSRHFHFSAIPPSIAASLEPMVEQPVASSSPGAFHSRASMLTQRSSISAVCGYSSLSIMFLSNVSAIRSRASSSIHVVTKRGQIQPRVAVENQLVSDQVVRLLRRQSAIGHAVLGHRLAHGPRTVGRREIRVLLVEFVEVDQFVDHVESSSRFGGRWIS